MKQHILALGAAAALGVASVTHAVVVFGPENSHPSLPTYFNPADPMNPKTAEAGVELHQSAGGIGNMLFAPYYNVQAGTATLINIANTDNVNGKAVKVRFRTAANSDDVLDFTLLLSPGDVWSGTLIRNTAGSPAITTTDNSCMLPVGGREQMQQTGVTLIDANLPSGLEPAALLNLMSEGYLEVLNMADIPQGSKLYTAIKHVDGKAPCTAGDLQGLLSTTIVSPAKAAADYGLYAPTGGLMGSWMIQNQGLLNNYSGNMTAVRAESADGFAAYGNVIFAPQTGDPIDRKKLEAAFGAEIDIQYAPNGTAAKSVGGLTADPLLSTTAPIQQPLWYDLPDMSTPMISGISTPQDQVMALELAQHQIFNFYVADAEASSGIPMYTDWVVSQPTRRYYAAVRYDTGKIVYNDSMGPNPSDYGDGSADTTVDATPADNVYSVLRIEDGKELGPFACLPDSVPLFGSVDAEEYAGTVQMGGGAFSPGKPQKGKALCGEVFVVSFTKESVFNAYTTRTEITPVGTAGMANYSFGKLGEESARALPVVGFAATSFTNQSTKASFGATMPHRWN